LVDITLFHGFCGMSGAPKFEWLVRSGWPRQTAIDPDSTSELE
jgi:hypothetical protein